MEPAIKDGAKALFSKTAKYKPGDIVCIWFNPDVAENMGAPSALKRLRLAIPPWLKSFLFTDNPKSDVLTMVVFEQDKPRIAYQVRCSDVAAIHSFVGIKGAM